MPSTRISTETCENTFEQLVLKLKDTLGSSGLTSEDIDLERLTQLMQEYESNETEWRRYALADPGKPYTRNLVDEGNGKSNLVCSHIVIVHMELLLMATAHPSLDARRRESHPQPQQRALPDEDPAGRAYGNTI